MLLVFVAVLVGWQALVPLVVASWLVGCCLPAVCFRGRDRLARFALALPLLVTIQLAHWGRLDQAYRAWSDVDFDRIFGAVHDESEAGGGIASHQVADDAIGF